MTSEIEAQTQKVRRFGRNFRSLSGVAGALLVITFLVAVLNVLMGPGPSTSPLKFGLGAYTITADHLSTMQVKLWTAFVVATVFAILLAIVLHLQRLFANLAAGSIYTRDNVRHLRSVGTLALAMAVFQLVLPLFSQGLVDIGVIDRTLVTYAEHGDRGIFLVGPSSLSGFIMAALVRLASWIMDVGRQTTDDIAVMRRDADLVI